MPGRRDQLPKSAVHRDNELDYNELLAKFGPAFHGDVARLFLLALLEPEQESAHLTEYLADLVSRRDAKAFKEAADAFAAVLKVVEADEPHSRSLFHAIRYEQEHQGEKRSAAGLLDYWSEHGVEVGTNDPMNVEDQLAYARRVRRRIGASNT